MKALLLAAGFGTRLHPLTQNTPKCLMRVGNQPMLNHWLYKLERLGVSEFIINTHYLAEKVHDFIDSHYLKSKIKLSFEPKLLGTANTLLRNLDALKNEDCFIVHVDNYCADPLDKMIEQFRRRPQTCVATMLVFQTDRPTECGIIEYDHNKIITGFYEKVTSPPSNVANGAVYLFSAEYLHQLQQQKVLVTDISIDIIPTLVGKMNCYFTHDYFQDIGKPETLDHANKWYMAALSK